MSSFPEVGFRTADRGTGASVVPWATALFPALLGLALFGTGAWADGGLIDPVAVLRDSGQLRHLETVASSASAQRLRLSWGTGNVPVDVTFSSEAKTAAQAQATRQITVSVDASAGHPPAVRQVQALREVAWTLATGCLNRPQPHLDLGNEKPLWFQITLTLRGDRPRCRMPSGAPGGASP